MKQREALHDKIHGALQKQLSWEIYSFNYQGTRKFIKFKLCIQLKRLKDSNSIKINKKDRYQGNREQKEMKNINKG